MTTQETERKDSESKRPKSIGAWLAIGAGIGVALGVATGNIGLWMPVGIAIGLAIGVGLAQRQRGA